MKRKSAAYKTRAFQWDTKAVSDDGLFSGYGSVFGVVDSYGEIVVPGAFAESLADLKAKERALPILWQHRTGEPIGDWQSLVEDGIGLKGDGALWMDEAPTAKIAYRGMKSRAITGLSIGYYVRDSSYDEKTGIRTLKAVDLVEVSIVTVPANDEARIDAVKSRIAHGELPSLSDFEGLLREAGFSKSKAAVIANRGLKHLLDRSESDGTGDVSELVKSISNFSLPSF